MRIASISFGIVTTTLLAVASGCKRDSKTRPESERTVASESEQALANSAMTEQAEPPSMLDIIAAIGGTPQHLDSLLETRVASPGRGPKTMDVYRRLGTATVVVRLADGYGTGVILSPATERWVLTNNHVVESAPVDDEGRRFVEIVTGHLEKGIIARNPEPLRAFVHARDPASDLALLRLESAPSQPGVELAAEGPSPGQTLIVMGHGNIGLLWQVRECDVSSIGRFSTDWAELPVLCRKNAENRRRCRSAMQSLGKTADTKLIQSTCAIAGGDSGGPALDESGKLVGLNSFVRKSGHRERVAEQGFFHIHVDAIREFIESARKAEPEVATPPGNLSLPGRDMKLRMTRPEPDVVLAAHHELNVLLVGVDVKRLPKDKLFAATIASLRPALTWYLSEGGQAVEYDVDEDGRPDIRLQGPQQALAGALKAERRSGDTWESARELIGTKILQPSLLGDKSEEVVKILARHLPAEVLERDVGPAGALPVPWLDGGPNLDARRIGDSYLVVQAGSPAVVWSVDLDGDTALEGETRENLANAYIDGKFDAELAFVVAGELVWAYADTDGIAGFDSIVFGRRDSKRPQAAFRVGTTSLEPVPLPDALCPLGRLSKEHRSAATKVFAQAAPGDLCR